MTCLTIEECQAHIPTTQTPDMEQWATENVLLHSRYIFTRREGHKQLGYCTHCQSTFRTYGLKHGTEATCPQCGSDCQVKAGGKGRKYMLDEGYFTYYLPSPIDPQTLVAIGVYAVRDYSGDYTQVQTRYAAT